MDGEQVILEKIADLKEFVKDKHDHLDQRIDDAFIEINRNKTSIAELYKLDRKQGEDLNKMIQVHEQTSAKIHRDVNGIKAEPAIKFRDNMKNLGWKIIIAVITSAVATYGLTLLAQAVGK